MAIHAILRQGDPRLWQPASAVTDLNQPALDTLVADMFDTMLAADGAGLAAPQIGIGLRVVIFGFDTNPRYPNSHSVPKTILINPEITTLGDEQEAGWEGCLSVPGMRGLVLRHQHIRYCGVDATGKPIEVEASGFHARVVQHECDHLDGILYTQRLLDPLKFGFTDELLSSGQLSSEDCSE